MTQDAETWTSKIVAQNVAKLTRYLLENKRASKGVTGCGSVIGGSTRQPAGIGSPGGLVEDIVSEMYSSEAEMSGPPSSPVRIPSSNEFLKYPVR